MYDNLSYNADKLSYSGEMMEVNGCGPNSDQCRIRHHGPAWQTDRLTARQIREQLYPDATKAQHGTVQKLLQRLEEKSYVERDRTLSIHFSSATVSRAAYGGGQLEALAEKLTAGSLAPMITHLIENKKIVPDEIARIRVLLNEQDGGETWRG